MEHVYLSSLVDKMKFMAVYYASDVIVRETKGNPPRPYWDIELRDVSGVKLGRVWAPRMIKDPDEARAWMTLKPHEYVAVEAHTESYMGDVRLIVDVFSAVDKSAVDMSLFVKTSDRAESDMTALNKAISHVENTTLREVLEAVIGERGRFRGALTESPGAENGPYNVRGGALMQTVDVVTVVESFVSLSTNDRLTQELAVTAALLANVGKVWAYRLDDGMPRLTTEGRLFGEPALSTRAIEKCFEGDQRSKLNYDVYMRLLHAVAASRWQGGQPQSYEAVVVRHVYEMTDAVSHVQNVLSSARGESIGGADFTPFDGTTRRCYLRPLTTSNEEKK